MKLSLQDQLFFVKRLSVLLGAGLTLPAALRSLEETPGLSRKLYALVVSLHTAIKEGRTLAVGLEPYRRVFGSAAISLVAVGESSGTLAVHLQYWHGQLLSSQRLQRKIKSSLVYPCIVLVLACAIGGVLMAFVFPKLLPIFSSLHFALPWSTRVLLWVYTFVTHWWVVILIVIVMLAVISPWALRVSFIWQGAVTLAFRLPILGKLLRSYYAWQFSRTLSALLEAEVPLLEAVRITSIATEVARYRALCVQAAERIREGNQLSTVLLAHPQLIPAHVAQLVFSGERTGSLAHVLTYASGVLADETDELLSRMSALFEPLLLIVVGLFVGFVAIAIITPIYGITQSLHI